MKTKPIVKAIFGQLAAFASRTVAPALALLAIALAVSTIGCTPAAETETKNSPADEPRTKERATDDEKPSAALPSDADCHRIARLFADAVFAGDYRAAYDLTSSRLQGRMSLEKFTAACKQAAQQFGEAVQLGKVVTDRTGGLAGSAASKQFGFPAEIPDGDRLAWAHFALALDVDGDEVLRCYDCWMLLENDRGKARIGHFAFLPCE